MESLVKKDWVGKRVLVTGHTGFKGAWLSAILSKLGAIVCGVSLEPKSSDDLFVSAGIVDLISSHNIADIRDRSLLEEIFREFHPNVVIHMAAQPLVRYSYHNPLETYEVNVIGTLNILDMCRKFADDLAAILVITTDKCYENKEQIWSYREFDPMGGFDPYSSSKGCCELLVQSYRRSYFSTDDSPMLASARAGNVIGGGDWSDDRLVPDVARAKQEGLQIVLRNPDSLRPWQHVLEPLSGYLILCQKLMKGDANFDEGWNFGPNDDDLKSVLNVVSGINVIWDEQKDFIVVENSELHEANLLMLDSTKAKVKLGWKPRWTIDECLVQVAAWYQAQSANENMYKKTIEQIELYFEGEL